MRHLTLGMMAAALAFGSAADAKWVVSWAAAPVTPSPAWGPFPATPAFHNQTIRQFLRLSAAGRALRVRLTNVYGETPLAIGAARIAILGPDGQERPGSSRRLALRRPRLGLDPARRRLRQRQRRSAGRGRRQGRGHALSARRHRALHLP